MSDQSLSTILADMEVDADITAELEELTDSDLIALWSGSAAQSAASRRQELAQAEIGRRGLSG